MSFFPKIGIGNRFYLGDSVLASAVADALAESCSQQVYLISRHSVLFKNHPNIIPIEPGDKEKVSDIRVIGFCDSMYPADDSDGKVTFRRNKLERMYTEVGLSTSHIRKPQLYLSKKEKQIRDSFRRFFPQPCVGVVLRSRIKEKSWPYVPALVKWLSRQGVHVFAIAKELSQADDYLTNGKVALLVGRTLRDLVIYTSMLDLVIGPDTGPMHIAGALDVPTVVIGFDVAEDLYEPYPDSTYVAASLPDVITRRQIYRYRMGSLSFNRVRKIIEKKLELANNRLRCQCVPSIQRQFVKGWEPSVSLISSRE